MKSVMGLIAVSVLFLATVIRAEEPAVPAARYLPDHPRMLLTLRVDDLCESKAYGEFKRQMPEFCKALDEKIAFILGVPRDNVEALHTGYNFLGKHGNALGVAHLKAATTFENIRDTKGGGRLRIDTASVGDHKYYTHTGGDSFALPDEKTLLLAEDFSIKPVLERSADAAGLDAIASLLKRAGADSAVVVSASFAKMTAEEAKVFGQEIPLPAEVVAALDTFTCEIEVGESVTGKGRLAFNNAAAADSFGKSIKDAIKVTVSSDQVSSELKTVLKGLEVSTSDATVDFKGQWNVADVVKMIPADWKKMMDQAP